MHRVLVCDDEAMLRTALRDALERRGYHVDEANDGREALAKLAGEPPDALVLDLRMPTLDGLSVLRALRERGSTVPVIVMTANGGVDTAIEATRLGAVSYLCKPFDASHLFVQLELAMNTARIDRRTLRSIPTAESAPATSSGERAVAEVAGDETYAHLIGRSEQMRRLFDLLRRLERIDAPTVLITGESGTGKDLVAQSIHSRGPRRDKPFMAVDCAAIPETLIESELFGHEKGAFTDAQRQKPGLFEAARGGVIFLDEIGEMPQATQAKLLRALENRRFRRVGGVVDLALDAAVIAATNRDLREAMKVGRFREDLFFRLNVVPIEIAPLRRRRDDIDQIARHLVLKAARDLRRDIEHIAEDALHALRAYDWPGNVRELRNVIERTVILKQDSDTIELRDLPPEIAGSAPLSSSTTAPASKHMFTLPHGGVDLETVERSFVEQALERTGGNRTQAARLLGISRFALRTRLEKYGLHDSARD